VSEDICYADATELAERIRSKSLSPVEVMSAFLGRIEAVNPRLNAVVTVAEDAMDLARAAEESVARGDVLGPLHGVPFTVKDCIDTAGVLTTRGSKLFEDRVPEVDAPVVKRLKDAGGILIGKTNMPEFALWWETGNAVFGRSENPWKAGRTTGGSSGGEAAALAAGLSPFGVGSDVGGSIRQPAGFCGVVGLKATHGRFPLTGHWPETLLRYMHVGPMARSVRDIDLGLSVMSGSDGIDPYAGALPPYAGSALGVSMRGTRIGWCAEGPFAPVAREVQDTVARAASAFEGLGCEVEPTSLDSWTALDPQQLTITIYAAEGSHYLKPFVAGREEELSLPMHRRMAWPAPEFSDYLDALQDVERLKQATATLFDRYDLLLCPSAPIPANPHDPISLDAGIADFPPSTIAVDGQQVAGRNALRATIPADFTGSPAISVPFGWSNDGLPIGVQLIGPHMAEAALLQAASALERLGDTAGRRPPV
jgi:Asp-tRNA(Asn)/Glu-tRNA(Gln) amidotransferase A subunit family amidase